MPRDDDDFDSGYERWPRRRNPADGHSTFKILCVESDFLDVFETQALPKATKK